MAARDSLHRKAARLAAEAKRRAETKAFLNYEHLLFPEQRAFIEDPAQLVLASCGRRGGKSFGIMAKLVKTAHEYPGCTVFYVTNTRRQAERGFWNQALQPFLKATGIQAKLNQNELTCTFTNGSRILCGGANDSAEIENYRGTKTPLAVFDEAQSFRPFLRTLIEDIFLPQTVDFGDAGQMLMTGTPNPYCTGFFHDAAHGKPETKGWSVHHWTMFENPHIPDPEGWLKRYVDQKGLTMTSPRIRREYFGEWIRDTEGLVYPVSDRMLLDELPDLEGWSFVLGIDLGYVDATAFATMAYHPDYAQAILVESHQQTQMLPDSVAAHVEALMESYDYESIVADAGGLGKPYVETMIQRHGLPVEAAQKTQKGSAVEHFRGDLQSGVLKIFRPGNEEWLHDASQYAYNYGKIDKAKHGGMALRADVLFDDRTPDHLLDAGLYAHRKCRQWLNSGARIPKAGTREALEAAEEAMWAGLSEADLRARRDWDSLQDELFADEALF